MLPNRKFVSLARYNLICTKKKDSEKGLFTGFLWYNPGNVTSPLSFTTQTRQQANIISQNVGKGNKPSFLKNRIKERLRTIILFPCMFVFCLFLTVTSKKKEWDEHYFTSPCKKIFLLLKLKCNKMLQCCKEFATSSQKHFNYYFQNFIRQFPFRKVFFFIRYCFRKIQTFQND